MQGSDLRIESQIPPGSGLGSSASLGVSVLRAMSQAFPFDIDPVLAAQLVQRSENDFVGAPVGILDPMVCNLGKPGMALFIDTRSLEHSTIPIPRDMELVVIHSGISHAHAHGQYGIRRQECERAAALLRVKQLRDLQGSAEMLEQRISALPEPYCRRARHVITENDRVLLAVAAFRRDDVSSIGALFHASHESLRYDYEASTPEIDLLVDLAGREPDILGARMTGGGFGGSVVMLARYGTAMHAGTRIASNYEKQSGRTPTLLVPEHFQNIRTASETEVRSCQ
jgi:galactokinase